MRSPEILRISDTRLHVLTRTSSRMSSLMMACSAPSKGSRTARPPTAIKMFFACRRGTYNQLTVDNSYAV